MNFGLTALDSSIVNVKGGSVNGSNGGGIASSQISLTAMGSSTVNIRGGSVGGGSMAVSVIVYNNSTVNITGGNIGGGVMAYNTGTINIRGGSLGSRKGGVLSSPFSLTAAGSKINLFGTGLCATPTSQNPRAQNQQYTLSGALSDGSSVNGIRFIVYGSMGASFTLHNAASATTRPHFTAH